MVLKMKKQFNETKALEDSIKHWERNIDVLKRCSKVIYNNTMSKEVIVITEDGRRVGVRYDSGSCALCGLYRDKCTVCILHTFYMTYCSRSSNWGKFRDSSISKKYLIEYAEKILRDLQTIYAECNLE